MASRGGSIRQRAPHPQASRPQRSYLATAPPRSGVRVHASGSGAPFDIPDEEMEDDLEELESSGGPPVSQSNRASWNDVVTACLLELCIEQRSAGTYNGAQMTADGYQAVIDGLLDRKQVLYTRKQVKSKLLELKSTHSF
jgi:hypothetical protein